MHDAALGSQENVPAIGGFSLGAKFVGLTAGLILLLSLTAFISLRNSAETVRQIGSVVEFAIPAYGALARSHIRSLEQAVELRRSLLLAEDPAVSDDAIAEHVQAFQRRRPNFTGRSPTRNDCWRASATARRPRQSPPICRG